MLEIPTDLKLRGARLKLLTEADADSLWVALAGDRERLRVATEWAATVCDTADARTVLTRVEACAADHSEFHFGVWVGDELAGACGYYIDHTLRSGQAEIGGWLTSRQVGRGLAVRVGRALLRWGFEGWRFRRLYARVPGDNGNALVLAERIGLVPEGVLVDAWDPVQERVVDMHLLAAVRRR